MVFLTIVNFFSFWGAELFMAPFFLLFLWGGGSQNFSFFGWRGWPLISPLPSADRLYSLINIDYWAQTGGPILENTTIHPICPCGTLGLFSIILICEQVQNYHSCQGHFSSPFSVVGHGISQNKARETSSTLYGGFWDIPCPTTENGDEKWPWQLW